MDKFFNFTETTIVSYSPNDGMDDDVTERFMPHNNPDNVISFETFTLIERVIFCYINPVIFCIGVPTNVLSCVVFLRQGLRDRMNLSLFCLSAVDLMYVVLFTVSGSHCFVEKIRADISEWYKWSLHKHLLGLYRAFLLCSGCLTMIIAVERCVCVFMPMKAVSLMKTRTMAALIGCTVVAIQLLCLVYPLKIDVLKITSFVSNHTSYKLVPSALYLHNRFIFDVIENMLIMNVIPLVSFTVVAASNFLTVVQLRRMIVWRENVSTMRNDSTTQQIALVKMLVIVSAIFILTSSPFVALSITSSVEPQFSLDGRYSNIFLAMYAIHLELGMVNSSLNFFVYVLRSSRFRQELNQLLSIRKNKKEKVASTGIVTEQSFTGGDAHSH